MSHYTVYTSIRVRTVLTLLTTLTMLTVLTILTILTIRTIRTIRTMMEGVSDFKIPERILALGSANLMANLELHGQRLQVAP
jgi:hypothetical protein